MNEITIKILHVLAEWFDDPNESPNIVVDLSDYKSDKWTPGFLLRLIADVTPNESFKPVLLAALLEDAGETVTRGTNDLYHDIINGIIKEWTQDRGYRSVQKDIP